MPLSDVTQVVVMDWLGGSMRCSAKTKSGKTCIYQAGHKGTHKGVNKYGTITRKGQKASPWW